MPSRIYSMIAILCLLTAGSVWSQDTKGTISGRVTDPSGSLQDIREFRGKSFLRNALQVVSRMT